MRGEEDDPDREECRNCGSLGHTEESCDCPLEGETDEETGEIY